MFTSPATAIITAAHPEPDIKKLFFQPVHARTFSYQASQQKLCVNR
jgi:hypothetical protein